MLERAAPSSRLQRTAFMQCRGSCSTPIIGAWASFMGLNTGPICFPRRVGQERALELTQSCKLIGTKAAREMGFLDDAFGADAETFEAELKERAQRLAQDPELRSMLRKKHESRLDDESVKPLASYRAEELDRMKVNFFGPDPAYHEARRRFVFKGNPPPLQNHAPVSAQIRVPQAVNAKGVAGPGPKDVSSSGPSRGANGFTHARRLEPGQRG